MSRILTNEDRKRVRAESAVKPDNRLYEIQEITIEPRKPKTTLKDVPEFNFLVMGEREAGKSLLISKLLVA